LKFLAFVEAFLSLFDSLPEKLFKNSSVGLHVAINVADFNHSDLCNESKSREDEKKYRQNDLCHPDKK
jgi:hypothetical protein